MGSFKLKRLQIPQTFIDVFKKQDLYTCKDVLSLTTTELQSLLGIDYNETIKIQEIISKKCVSEPHTVHDICVNQKGNNKNNFFASSLYELDMLLQGGLLLGNLTEIAGPPGVGKTQFCFMLCIQSILPESMGGLNGQVIYIDTESAFCVTRLKEMAASKYPSFFKTEENIQQLLQGITVLNATSINVLKEIVLNIEQDIIKQKVKLVIIDSIASLFRKEYGASDLQNIVERNKILLEQASILKDIALTYEIVVFLTNQITSQYVESDFLSSEYFPVENVDDSEDNLCQSNPIKKVKLHEGTNLDHIIPALGITWHHCVNTRFIAQFLDSEVRQLIIAKSPVAPNAIMYYILNETGLISTGHDVNILSAFNSQHQNIITKYNFLSEGIASAGAIFS